VIKVFELLNRRSDMTHTEAMDYWTRNHARLVKNQTSDSGILLRYLNNVGIPTAFAPGSQSLPYDGAVEALLEVSIEQFCKMLAVEDNAVIADEPNFLSASPLSMVVDPDTIKAFRAPFRVKLLMFWKRRPELSQRQAEKIWLERCAPAEIEYWGDALTGYIANRCQPVKWGRWGEEMPPHDGVAEYYFDIPAEDLTADWAKAIEALGDDAHAFASDIRLLRVEEIVQVGAGAGPT
jgi:EthD domain